MRTRAGTAPGAAVLLVLGASIAQAACPTAADMSTGVRFVDTEGAVEVHTRLDAQRVQVDYISPDTPGAARSVMIHGVYAQWYGGVLDSGGLEPGSLSYFFREMPVDQMPVPEPGLIATIDQLFIFDGSLDEEVLRVSVGAPEPWTLGDCTLTRLPVEIVTEVPSDTIYEFFGYLPELGTGVLTRYHREDATIQTYHYISVTADPG